jgi:GntR family transcriptional regulator/MocR family aminotransferase
MSKGEDHLSRAATELPLSADRGTGIPLSGQIAGQIRSGIADGRLGAGERLPAGRVLAVSLGVSRTVVTAAYAQLYAEGWLEGRHGSGTFVAAGAPGPAGRPGRADLRADPAARRDTAARPDPAGRPDPAALADPAGPAGHLDPAAPAIELRPGIPWAGGIDLAAWRRAWRQAGTAAPSAWPDPLGLPELRIALAAQLRRSRAMHCDPGQILVTRGVTSGLGLLAAALLRPGERVGVEEPGYPAARAVFAAHGAQVVPCRADEHGLVISELPGDLRMVYTTPAHQYPLGGRLPVPRRQSLMAWARATGALIVEDDYDSEFRYDVAPLPALFGLDPEAVIYLGTTAKTLTPAMGVGWLVARRDLAGVIAGAKQDISDRTPEAAQHALLALLRSGDLDRHVRRMRREYARRRSAIVTALSDLPAPARLLGDTAGLHVVLVLTAGTAGQVAATAGRRGVAVTTMARYFTGRPSVDGLVLGYGGATVSQVSRACRILRQIVTAPGDDLAGQRDLSVSRPG